MGLDGVEYYGGVGFLKAGLQAAWAITTVSPTYAQEIRSPEFGMGLDGLINMRSVDLHGIVNGIDVEIWNPETDAHLSRELFAEDLEKPQRQQARRRGTSQPRSRRQPDHLRGQPADLAEGHGHTDRVLDGLVASGARLAVLGSGDAALEGALLAAAARHRGRVGVVIGYDEGLSHLMQGGCDAIVIPSRFEPCGLTQLYGLRYGCVPIVARTGGLADTVIDANEAALAAGVATGFQFEPANAGALLHAVRRMVAAYAEPCGMDLDPAAGHEIRRVVGPKRPQICRALSDRFFQEGLLEHDKNRRNHAL